jgi:hypothetical protein
MRYHVPPDKSWDAEAIVDSLQAQSLDADRIDATVHLRIPLPAATRQLARLYWAIIRRKPFLVTVKFNPNKFIRNVDVEYDIMRKPINLEWMYWMDAIDNAMADNGYFVIDSVDSEREVALQYCADRSVLIHLYDNVLKLEAEKVESLNQRDYENAARVQNRINDLRDQIDAKLAIEQRT